MFGMRVLHCQEPPGLELFGHAPQFNANNFSHVFKHGSRYSQLIEHGNVAFVFVSCRHSRY